MVSLKRVAPTIRARLTAPQAAEGNPAMQPLQQVTWQQVTWQQVTWQQVTWWRATGRDVERSLMTGGRRRGVRAAGTRAGGGTGVSDDPDRDRANAIPNSPPRCTSGSGGGAASACGGGSGATGTGRL